MDKGNRVPETDFWQANRTRQCPYCSNIIPATEDPCHHCGHLEPADEATIREIGRKEAKKKLIDILLDLFYRIGG